MKKSIFAQKYICGNTVVLYNSVVRKPVFITREEYEKIISDGINEELKKQLKLTYYFVKDEKEDELIIKSVKRYAEEQANIFDTIYIFVTNACNLKCDYCLVHQYRNAKKLSKETFDIFYEKIKSYIEYSKTDITFILYGGEPTLDIEQLRYIVKKLSLIKNCKIGIVSNGTMLDEEVISLLDEHEVRINISLDGLKEISDLHRKFVNCDESVYEKVEYNLMKLKGRINMARVGLSITITPELLDRQKQVISWVENMGIRNVVFNTLKLSDIVANHTDYYHRMLMLQQKAYDYLFEKGIIEGNTFQYIECFKKSGVRISSCAAIGGKEMALDVEGNMYLCHACMNDENLIGDVNGNFIFKNKNRMTDLLPINQEKCFSCKAFAICGGGCYYEKEKEMFCLYMREMVDWIVKKIWFNS